MELHEGEDDVESGDLSTRFIISSSLVKDACLTRLEINYKRDLESVKKYEAFYGKYAVALCYFLSTVNLFTTILEHPASLLVNEQPLPYYVPLLINMVCEAYFYYRWYLIHTMTGTVKCIDKISSNVCIGILLLMSLDAVTYVLCQELNGPFIMRWSRFLRPILILTFPENRRLRAAFFNLRRTAVDVIPVFGLFLSTLALVGIVAMTSVAGLGLKYPSGEDYFVDYVDVFWDLYALSTTTNSPDMIVPPYEYNGVYINLYVFVCTVCNWLFMGILTASVYNSYKDHLGEFILNTVGKQRQKLDEAFSQIASLTPTGESGVNLKTFVRLMRSVNPRRSEDSMRIIFHVLNSSRSGFLSMTEFSRLAEYMQVRLVEVDLTRQYFQCYLPRFYNLFSSPSFQTFKRAVDHELTKAIFISLVVTNAITTILFRNYLRLASIFEWIFSVIFLTEILLNYLACGGVRFFRDWWNVFDCLIVGLAFVGHVFQLILTSIGLTIPDWVTRRLLLLRLLRLLKVFSSIPTFKIVVTCVLNILPSLTTYVAMLLILFYIFACLGMENYYGYYQPPEGHLYNETTDCGNPNLANTEFVTMHYCLFNFNSVTESYIMLLALTVGNNWHIFAEGLVAVTNRWTRFYFLLVHWTCVLLVLNVVLAFIIEAYLIEYDSQGTEFEAYIRQRLDELGMNATTELEKRGIRHFPSHAFQITKSQLDLAFPTEETHGKAFLVEENASIEVLMFRMFERDVSELSEHNRSSSSHSRVRNIPQV